MLANEGFDPSFPIRLAIYDDWREVRLLRYTSLSRAGFHEAA